MTTVPAIDDTLAPAETVRRLAAAAERIETPCGDGAMVWHRWPGSGGDAPPLVLLHGGFGSWTHWIRAIPALTGKFTVIAADLPGLGASADAPRPHSAEGLAAILSDGLDRVVVPPAPFHLAGFSFGGLLGGHVAAAQGARALSFTAVGASGFGSLHDPPQGLRVPPPGMADHRADAIHANNLKILMFHDAARIDALAVHTHRLNITRARVRSRSISVSDALLRALPGIRAPIAGIWGEFDATAGGRAAIAARRDLFQRHQPGAPFHVMKGVGHWAMYEAAAEFAGLLAGIIEGSGRDSRDSSG